MIFIVCLSLSSFSSTSDLTRSDTGNSWHMVRIRARRNWTASREWSQQCLLTGWRQPQCAVVGSKLEAVRVNQALQGEEARGNVSLIGGVEPASDANSDFCAWRQGVEDEQAPCIGTPSRRGRKIVECRRLVRMARHSHIGGMRGIRLEVIEPLRERHARGHRGGGRLAGGRDVQRA
eukprot:scaffold112272_cov32-Tisochrysis_lutea.AAC.6